MKYVRICDTTQDDKVVAYMPLFVWRLTEWMCKREDSLGMLAGFISLSYQWDYLDYGRSRSWLASLWSGVRLWWITRNTTCC